MELQPQLKKYKPAVDLQPTPEEAVAAVISKPQKWYDLGCQVGDASKHMERMAEMIQCHFGKSHSCFKALSNFNRNLWCQLQGDLDELVCAEFPKHMHYLPGYDVTLTEIFYNLNRYTTHELNGGFKLVRPLPKTLSKGQAASCLESIQFVLALVNKLDGELFNNKNKSIVKMRTSLEKVKAFCTSM
jgi:hypothetical protein